MFRRKGLGIDFGFWRMEIVFSCAEDDAHRVLGLGVGL